MTEKPKPGAYKDLECTQPAREGDRVAVWVDKYGHKLIQPTEYIRPVLGVKYDEGKFK